MRINMLLSLTLASTAIFAQATNERISMEGVDVMASITFGEENEIGENMVGIYELPYSNSYKPLTSTPLISGFFAGGSTYHDGKIYCNRYDDSGNTQLVRPVWQVYDADTYQLLYERELGDNCEYTTRSLAYDQTTDMIYGFVTDYSDTHLVRIDPETGEMTRIGENFERYNHYGSLACSRDGQLFAIVVDNDYEAGTSDLMLAKIRKTDARLVKVGSISCNNLMGEDLLIYMNYDQALFFNNETDELYWFMGSSSTELNDLYTPLFRINTLTAEATLVSYMDKVHHISGAFLKEPDQGAPAIIRDFSFIADQEGAVSGRLQIDMPQTTYGGSSLDGMPLTLTVSEGGTTIISAETTGGETFISDELSLSGGTHTLSVTVSNDVGNSPTVEREIYVGYDIPAAPSNVTLTYEGLTTTLTWDAPTEGINGMPINPDNFTYTVVRYPYEVTVAEGLKECRFVETHPADMTRYIYTVRAIDGDRVGEFSYSNALIIGEPLRPPYGGIFTDVADMYNYYTLIDANGDGYCWTYDSNTASAVYIYNQFEDADDWMISPLITFEAATTYELTFKAYSSMAEYPESLEVRLGRDRTPEAMTELLLELPEVPAVDEDNPVQEFSTEFTTDDEGLYFYGFHVVSPMFHEYLYIFDIKVQAKGSGQGLNDNTQQSIRVVTGERHLSISNPERLEMAIYDTRGISVCRTNDSDVELELPEGIYIIKTPDGVQKTMVH